MTNEAERNCPIKELIVSLGIFVALFLVCRLTELDLVVSDAAYAQTSFESCKVLTVLAFLGKYLCIPLGLYFCYNFVRTCPEKPYLRKEAFFCLAVLVIGPGAFTNFALKKPFNRHRPHEIQRYDKNSELAFVKVFNIGKNDSSNSFTSGHAGAAFFFLVPWFIGRLRSKYGWKILLPALFWGGFVSTIRILQGNHFFSDCLGSLVVVYLTGLLLSHVCRVYST